MSMNDHTDGTENYWHYLGIDGPQPSGKMHVLTTGNQSVIGDKYTQGIIAWAPLMKRDHEKEALQRQYADDAAALYEAGQQLMFQRETRQQLRDLGISESFLDDGSGWSSAAELHKHYSQPAIRWSPEALAAHQSFTDAVVRKALFKDDKPASNGEFPPSNISHHAFPVLNLSRKEEQQIIELFKTCLTGSRTTMPEHAATYTPIVNQYHKYVDELNQERFCGLPNLRISEFVWNLSAAPLNWITLVPNKMPKKRLWITDKPKESDWRFINEPKVVNSPIQGQIADMMKSAQQWPAHDLHLLIDIESPEFRSACAPMGASVIRRVVRFANAHFIKVLAERFGIVAIAEEE